MAYLGSSACSDRHTFQTLSRFIFGVLVLMTEVNIHMGSGHHRKNLAYNSVLIYLERGIQEKRPVTDVLTEI